MHTLSLLMQTGTHLGASQRKQSVRRAKLVRLQDAQTQSPGQ